MARNHSTLCVQLFGVSMHRVLVMNSTRTWPAKLTMERMKSVYAASCIRCGLRLLFQIRAVRRGVTTPLGQRTPAHFTYSAAVGSCFSPKRPRQRSHPSSAGQWAPEWHPALHGRAHGRPNRTQRYTGGSMGARMVASAAREGPWAPEW